MAARGHALTIVCRNQARADHTLRALSGAAQILICDLADLDAVQATTAQLLEQGVPLDALVLTAGLQYTGERQPRWSVQGIELTFAVNQLAHQVMATALLPLLRAASRPRVVITASEVHNPPAVAAGWESQLGLVISAVWITALVLRCWMAVRCSMATRPTRTASSAMCCWRGN